MSENNNSVPASDAEEEARRATLQRLVPEVRTALQHARDVRAWPLGWEQDSRIDYFYRHGCLLTRDRDAENVRHFLEDQGLQMAEEPDLATPQGRAQAAERSLIRGVTRLDVRHRDSQHTPQVLDHLDSRFGVGVATLDHAFVVCYDAVCPATEPEPVITPAAAAEKPALVREALWPSPGDDAAGRDVRVAVVDTGLLKGAAAWAPWIDGVRADAHGFEDPDQISIHPFEPRPDGFADPYAGHGTFVSGVVRCVAPGSDVVVERILEVAGFARESSLVHQIDRALSRSPDLINMSAGGYTRNNVPSLAFQTLWEERLSQLGGIVLVAAAGNDARTAPFWPAAFPWCVGVGSMTRDGQRRSWFSNHGAWVDVYAPGEDIVNAYPRMRYKAVDGEERDTSAGIVKWSGTSFATPVVTGLIAARMSRTGENARQAADALVAGARCQFRPGVGPRLFP